MRKESSNQFTEGLVCDLNPINTPNTILTDALNATIITYDGNEFSLQNDRGNYPLENCRLKPNYIPVGLKEYGDILYIVSYNPLDNHVEIGSYPSPMNVINSNENNTLLELQSVLENAKNEDLYSELIEKCEMKIWTSNNEEDSKLYPGDKYKIEESNKSEYKYETLEYYIVDENRKKYNVSDLIKFGDFYNVSWQVPGWLSTQYRLATFDDFTMSVRSIEAPSLGNKEKIDCNLKLNFQFRISDKLFLPTEHNDVKSDVYIKLEITNSTDVTVNKEICLSDGKFIEWYSDSKILWIDSEDILINGLKLGDTLSIKATPFIQLGTGVDSKIIIYDSFVENRTILLNVVGDYDDFRIGDELWKFYIDDDDRYLYLEYDVTGPYVTTSEVNLYYRILNIDGVEKLTWRSVNDYTGITNQGVGILPFEGEFVKEDMYIIEFAFYKKNASNEDLSKRNSIKKVIIASKIFSDFVGEYSDFNQIGFDEWINKYKNSIDSKKWTAEYVVTRSEDYNNYSYDQNGLKINNAYLSNEALKNLWNVNYKGTDKGLLDSSEWDKVKDRVDQLIDGEKKTLDITLKHNTIALQGPLWDNTPNITVNTKSYVSDKKIDCSRETLSSGVLNTDIESVFGNTLDVSYESKESFEFLDNIVNIQEVPVMHVHFEGTRKNQNSWIRYIYSNLGTYPNTLKYSNESVDTTDDHKITGINNNLSKAIYNMLGTRQMGVLFSTICLAKGNSGTDVLQYRHGDTLLWSDYNGSGTYLFTYLVFRRKTGTNSVVLIELGQSTGLWNIFVGEGNMPKLDDPKKEFDAFELLGVQLNKLCTNITLCTENNSVKTGTAVNIKADGPHALPICTLDVSTEQFTSWPYTATKTYDLLSATSRAQINNNLKDLCGNLFTGNTSVIKQLVFFKHDFENNNVSDNALAFKTIEEYIVKNNGFVSITNSNSELLNQIKRMGTKTKGVYWIGDATKPEKLIELLHSNYSNNTNQYLSVESSKLVEANVYIKGEKEGINFAQVDTEVYV